MRDRGEKEGKAKGPREGRGTSEGQNGGRGKETEGRTGDK